MTQHITCMYCGSAIRFKDEDRGYEVYCASCARANTVPASMTDDDVPEEAASTVDRPGAVDEGPAGANVGCGV